MRAVRGLDRPGVQWTFVALAAILIVLTASLAIAVRRLNGSLQHLHASRMQERSEREQLEARLARERSTREALSLELGRLRSAGPVSNAASEVPTLTLEPLRARASTPPPATMSAPAPTQIVQVRLVLPPAADAARAPFTVSVRDWTTGDVRWTRGGLSASALDRGKAVAAYVAGDVFPAGAHEVILRNRDAEVATYEITVK